MAIHFNQSTIAPIITDDGVARQPLLNKQRVPDAQVSGPLNVPSLAFVC
jgi:hypothetical protein